LLLKKPSRFADDAWDLHYWNEFLENNPGQAHRGRISVAKSEERAQRAEGRNTSADVSSIGLVKEE